MFKVLINHLSENGCIVYNSFSKDFNTLEMAKAYMYMNENDYEFMRDRVVASGHDNINRWSPYWSFASETIEAYICDSEDGNNIIDCGFVHLLCEYYKLYKQAQEEKATA